MPSIPFVKRVVPGKWMRTVQERRVALTVSHLFGPKHIRMDPEQAVVIASCGMARFTLSNLYSTTSG